MEETSLKAVQLIIFMMIGTPIVGIVLGHITVAIIKRTTRTTKEAK